MCKYIAHPLNILNHLDLSGMNMGGDALLAIGTAVSANDNIQTVHLSDNGLRLTDKKDFMMELLDLFIDEVNDDLFKGIEEFEYKVNLPVKNPEILRQIIIENTHFVSSEEVKQNSPRVNTLSYHKHLV